jgi:GntR family transcriptional regulator
VELLAQEGFVSIQQGKGTEVLDYKATQRLQYVTSFSETLRDKGFTVRFRDLSVNSVAAPRRVAAELRVPPDTRLVRVQRVTLANGKPVADVLNYLLPAIVPGIERRIAGMKSLYAFLESEYNLRIEAATDWISATAADAPVASRLEVPEGSPLLVVRRITYSRGRPIEVAVLHVLADKYEYCVQSKDRPPRAE